LINLENEIGIRKKSIDGKRTARIVKDHLGRLSVRGAMEYETSLGINSAGFEQEVKTIEEAIQNRDSFIQGA
jgi:hypothetical protein